MTSYEIASMILDLRGQLEEGIIDEQTFLDTVESISAGDKLNGLIYATKRIESEIGMLKAEKKRIDAEIKKQEQNTEKIKGFINMIMTATDAKKFDGVAGKISYRKSSSVEVDRDFIDNNIGCEFITEETSYKLDKKALKKHIEECGPIEGAKIVEKQNLQVK